MFFSNARYRVWTVVRSVYSLLTLPQETMDDFLGSYKLFEADRVTDDNEKLIIAYYKVLNHLCALGQVEKMYIPPLMDEKAGIWRNQELFEDKMMADLKLQPGMHVLETGCGRGRIACHVATTAKCRLTGVNIDAEQLRVGREYVAKNGLDVELIEQSYNDPLPFANETFDAVYNVQAWTYIKDYDVFFAELFRIMKPGARLSTLDWFLYKNFDPVKHAEMLQRVKALIGAVHDPTPEEMVGALEKAGFKVVLNENASVNDVQYPLIDQADKYFNMLLKVVDFLCYIWLLPKHLQRLFHRFSQDGQMFVEGDRLGYWTSVHHIVVEKPM